MSVWKCSALAVVAGVAVLAAGCGGGDEGVSPATEWAGGVCSALTTWKDSVAGAGSSLQGGNLSREALSSAASDVEDATKQLGDDLHGLGRPDTQAGQEAQDTIDTLAGQLSDEAKTISDTVDNASGVSGVVQAVSTVAASLGTMGQQVGSAVATIEALNGADELKQAFQEADSCSSFTGS